jgi:hypothetical protein
MYNSILLSDLPPAALVVVVAVVSALPAYWTLRKGKPGRARSAVAYLTGFVPGLLATVAFGAMLEPLAAGETPLALVGMIAAFIGPFVGMVHAKLAAPPRRKQRRPANVQWEPTR